MALTSVALVATVYIAVGLLLSFMKGDDHGYGLLPSFALGREVNNQHRFISLAFFTVVLLVEGLGFAYFLDSVRKIKRDFSMLPELQVFAGVWLITSDLALWFVIQGISSQWFTNKNDI